MVDYCQLLLTFADLFPTVVDFCWLWLTVSNCCWLFPTLADHGWLFPTVGDCFQLWLTVSNCSWLLQTSRDPCRPQPLSRWSTASCMRRWAPRCATTRPPCCSTFSSTRTRAWRLSSCPAPTSTHWWVMVGDSPQSRTVGDSPEPGHQGLCPLLHQDWQTGEWWSMIHQNQGFTLCSPASTRWWVIAGDSQEPGHEGFHPVTHQRQHTGEWWSVIHQNQGMNTFILSHTNIDTLVGDGRWFTRTRAWILSSCRTPTLSRWWVMVGDSPQSRTVGDSPETGHRGLCPLLHQHWQTGEWWSVIHQNQGMKAFPAPTLTNWWVMVCDLPEPGHEGFHPVPHQHWHTGEWWWFTRTRASSCPAPISTHWWVMVIHHSQGLWAIHQKRGIEALILSRTNIDTLVSDSCWFTRTRASNTKFTVCSAIHLWIQNLLDVVQFPFNYKSHCMWFISPLITKVAVCGSVPHWIQTQLLYVFWFSVEYGIHCM